MMMNWLIKLIQKKLNGETYEQKVTRRILEADHNELDRARMNPAKPWKDAK
jgi:hypothetical protein